MDFFRIDPQDNEDFKEVRTIEEAIEYGLKHHKLITKEEMIAFAEADLKKYKIDIRQDDYDTQNNNAFRKLDYIFVSEGGRLISESWFVEKYMIGLEKIEEKYSCYLMGIERKLTTEELEWDSLYGELDNKYPGSDARRNIIRNEADKPGLLQRIKSTFGFDIIEDFPNQQPARMKLVYLLYCFERDFNVEFTSYFNNQTLENLDDIIINEQTKNGHLLEYLRRHLVRELDVNFIRSVNTSCCKMIEDWENQLRELMFKLDTLVTRDTKDELYRECNLALELFEPVAYITEHGKYKHNLLETTYLKLWQYENICKEKEILEITERTQEFLAELPDDLSEYQKLAGKTVLKENLQEFLSDKDNRKHLAKLIFMTDKVDSNKYKKYDTASEKIEYYLDILNQNTSVNKFIDIPQLLVVAAMQEIIFIDKTEFINNPFYRHTTSEKERTLNSDLPNGTNAFRKNQLAWVGRVNTRYNAYNGRKEEALLAYRTQSALDKIIYKLCEINSVKDMWVFHNFFMQLAEEVLIAEELYEKNIEAFEKSVGRRKKGYKVVNKYSFDSRRFFSVTVRSGIIDQLAKRTAKRIFEAEQSGRPIGYWHPIELQNNHMFGSDEYNVAFRVYPEEKAIEVIGFENNMDPERKQIMKENGITVL
jgi:hypothetical protein